MIIRHCPVLQPGRIDLFRAAEIPHVLFIIVRKRCQVGIVGQQFPVHDNRFKIPGGIIVLILLQHFQDTFPRMFPPDQFIIADIVLFILNAVVLFRPVGYHKIAVHALPGKTGIDIPDLPHPGIIFLCPSQIDKFSFRGLRRNIPQNPRYGKVVQFQVLESVFITVILIE